MIKSAPALIPLVERDGANDERGKTPKRAECTSVTENERARPRDAGEGGPVAIFDARVDASRCLFARERRLEGRLPVDRIDLAIVKIEIEVVRTVADKLRIGRSGIRVVLAKAHELERIVHEERDPFIAKIARVDKTGLLAAHDAEPEPSRARLFEMFGLAHAHGSRKVLTARGHGLSDLGALRSRLLDRTRGAFDEFVFEFAHSAVPPTVMERILTVGHPTPTGTLWPSLPHVHTPSEAAKSFPSMTTSFMTSGPFPMRFTPLRGAVILPSSIKYPSVMLKTKSPLPISTCPPPNFFAKIPYFTEETISSGSD